MIFLGLFLIIGLSGWWIARKTTLDWRVVGLRLASLACILLALALPRNQANQQSKPLILLVDQSANLPSELRDAAWNEAVRFYQQQIEQRPVRLLAFGADVRVSQTDQRPAIDPNGSDLAGALQFASGLLPQGGDIILLSDGASTTTNGQNQVSTFAQRSIRLHGVPMSYPETDIRVESLIVPPALREGERFSADVVLYSSVDGQVRLELSSDGVGLAGQTINVTQGRNLVSFQSTAGARGFHRFQAMLLATNDQQPANNQLDAWTVVGPPPRVLIIERSPDSSANLRDALEAANLVTEALRPTALPTSLSQLRVYDSIVLQDISANDLSLDQQLALREFVRSLGHGVVVLGGTNSYNLGSYAGTPLEELLPVSMEPPPRRERPTVTLLLILDRSASMLGETGKDKFSLAKAAAIAATDSLGADDTIGVLAFDDTNDWTVTFTKVGQGVQLSEIQNSIAGLSAGGGTNIYAALEVGMGGLAQQTGKVRHAVLLTDGRSGGESSYESLIAPLRAQGITLSTIAIGGDADTVLLESLAKLGAGRYHFASRPDDLPRLTLQEAEIARENPLTEGQFQANLATPHPAIRGLNLSEIPPFGGYVAVTPKPEAEQLLTTTEGDILLATWQYGLGRATAFTSDSGERWTATWRPWPNWGNTLAQIIAATYPNPARGDLRISSELQANQAIITLDAQAETGELYDLADVGLRVLAPDGNEQILRAPQIAPGRYQALADAPQTGAYHILAALEQGSNRLETQAGVIHPYNREWAVSANPALLEQLVGLGQGQIGSLEQIAPSLQVANQTSNTQWWPWLITLALALWIVEIAIRRGVIR